MDVLHLRKQSHPLQHFIILELQSRPIWWHYMSVIIPDRIERDSGFLFIDGGSNTDRYEFYIICGAQCFGGRVVDVDH